MLSGRRMVVPVAQPIEASPSPPDVVGALVSPPREPAGLTTALPDVALVLAVDVRAGVAQVDLAPAAAAVGSGAQVMLAAQLVCILTALPAWARSPSGSTASRSRSPARTGRWPRRPLPGTTTPA